MLCEDMFSLSANWLDLSSIPLLDGLDFPKRLDYLREYFKCICMDVSIKYYFRLLTRSFAIFALARLAPGQWKGFLAVYAGFYVFNNFIRPMRLAASVGVSPYFEKAVEAIQKKTKLNKSVSIGIVVFLANVCGTTSLMSLGIYVASLAAGVPIFPPKS